MPQGALKIVNEFKSIFSLKFKLNCLQIYKKNTFFALTKKLKCFKGVHFQANFELNYTSANRGFAAAK